jgi:threonyl-tRNA synthetase
MAVDSDEVRSRAEELLDAGAHDRLDTMRHSAAHMMAAAVLELFPGAKLGIGPAIKDGFYYDFDLPRALGPADLEAIEAKMREQVTAGLRFERSELPRDQALAQLEGEGQDYKVEIIRDLPPEESETVSFYRHGAFSDLCRGPHLDSTAALGPFKLLNSAAAYWRGDESRPMLQRVYGTVWGTQEELDRYLWRLEEARARDHRKVGRELDLFTFHPESPAAPFWHPKGMALWRALEDWSREVRREGGFVEVRTPSLVRKELWEQSGHWDLYQDNMFVLDDSDHISGLKPMNCPEEILIYKTRSRSYRDLPMRLNDYSLLFRKERSGALAGLFRVRQLTQDDSHVFCRDDSPVRSRGLTAPASASRSPTTTMTGTFCSWASRSLACIRSERSSTSTRIPASKRRSRTSAAYSAWRSAIGTIATWTGATHSGKAPAKCSVMTPMKRSNVPKMA